MTPAGVLIPVEFKHFHMCGGSGSGAAGFNDATAQLGSLYATGRCLGSVDVDPAGGGPHSVADPRPAGTPFNHVYRIVRFDETAPAVTGPGGPAGVADPRYGWDGAHENKMAVRDWDEPAKTVTGSDRVGSGAQSIADPRPAAFKEGRQHFEGGGHYGVVSWEQPSGAVTASGQVDNGRWSVADPRPLPTANDKVVCIIRAIDGTWHRPFTTLECAALQSMFDPEKYFTSPEVYWDLHGMSDSAKRERIGNAVPRKSSKGMASAIYTCLLHAMNGETFMLSSQPIWVQPVALALGAARIS